MKVIAVCFYLFLLLMSQASQANEIKQVKIFQRDSYQNLLKENQHKSFLLVLWSLDCSPCMAELEELSNFHRTHKDIDLVFVSTDTPSQIEEIKGLMLKHELTDLAQWVFSDQSIQHLRFSIDPAWYGELPRSYFHKPDGTRIAVTGRLDQQRLLSWYR